MIDILLKRLNRIAIEVDRHEYGLPLYHEQDKDKLRKVVADWTENEMQDRDRLLSALCRAHNIIDAFVRIGATDNLVSDANEVLLRDGHYVKNNH